MDGRVVPAFGQAKGIHQVGRMLHCTSSNRRNLLPRYLRTILNSYMISSLFSFSRRNGALIFDGVLEGKKKGKHMTFSKAGESYQLETSLRILTGHKKSVFFPLLLFSRTQETNLLADEDRMEL